MSKTHLTLSAAALNKQPVPASLGRDNLLSILESVVGPGAFVFSLWALAYYFEGGIYPPYLILSVIVFALTFPGQARLQSSIPGLIADIAVNWAGVAGLLLISGFATGYLREFSKGALITWLWVAPLTELGACFVLRIAAPMLLELQGPRQRAIIVGMNEQGLALADKIKNSPYARIELTGFVDSRSADRLSSPSPQNLLGKLSDLASLVQANRIQLIYLSLPMASQPRILQILDELKDTTASIYFVPDMFVTDLIQGQPGSVCGMPVISVCDTPFKGADGALKRISDVVLSLLILVLISPLLLVIAIAVKMDSSGPVIFKQRRYGQDGEEILIYKFRSMTVTEDGGTIKQAEKNDQRITRLGAFLRRSSLDELPQFVNVLQGRMSIVGPRPHAVAHNELYRKLIKGYMVRHKVKPGITGWAQVNGYRGETRTLDKMQGRIDFDLDYLRNWSLRLDIHIILKTIRLVLKDQQAY
ncbi:undecaprenyl-phosphate glucose phosphotransferase [Rhodoferax sp.]|uniref:undecaprenyl-phosphate glucose phosphotransferase n=1 Tax=Rhodoferax sp. TaxID=50421 RepID=UPI00271BED2C|nr:undecaprenyl-phosphate glucose phosphotransferase [Rhodoferax sp.]MDO9196990.1 undecaprenyl-phosphate glucose phosphotransferase [Rhodoferax sp.]